MEGWQKFVYWAQWVPVVAIPIWWVRAPGAGDPGWNALGMMLFGSLAAVAVAITALISARNRVNRQALAVSRASAWAVPLLWVVAWLPPVFLDGSGDVWSSASYATQWWGLPGWAGSGPLFVTSLLVFAAAWVAALVASCKDTDVRARSDGDDDGESARSR